jgi:hypothetical protein
MNLSERTFFSPQFGSLYDFLHGPKGMIQRKKIAMDERRAAKIAESIATGMQFLHTNEPPILHMDLQVSPWITLLNPRCPFTYDLVTRSSPDLYASALNDERNRVCVVCASLNSTLIRGI